MLRQHLRAEAEAEKGPLLAKRHADPVDLLLHEVVRVVGAHRAAEDDGARMAGEGFGQRIAVARAADVEAMAAFEDAGGRRARASNVPDAG